MSNLSRRTLVSSAAALPALAVPALASVDNPDAELLQLGAQLKRVEIERSTQIKIDQMERGEFEAACERAGLPQIAFGSIPDDEWHAYKERRAKLWQFRPDEDKVWEDITSRLYALANEILARKAATTAGLAVQARAVVLAAAELWDGVKNPDNPPKHEQMFIEAACAHFGMDAKQIALAL